VVTKVNVTKKSPKCHQDWFESAFSSTLEEHAMDSPRRNPTLFPYRGKWRVTYSDLTGKTRSKTVATQRDGYMFIAELQRVANAPQIPQPAPPQFSPEVSSQVPTVEEWLTTWMNLRSQETSFRTQLLYRSVFTTHVIPAFGPLRIDQVTVHAVESFYHSLLANKGLALSTVHRIHTAFAAALHSAYRQSVVASDPMKNVVKPKVPKPHVTPLTEHQRERLWAVVDTLPARDQLRWVLALTYGLRQGEALGLQRQDFDPSTSVLSIRRQLLRIPRQGWTFTQPKSTQGLRDIPLDEHTTRLFAETLRGLPAGCKLIFPNPKGKPKHTSTDRKAWLRLLKKAGIPPVSLHTARHTAATVMITSGVDVKTVQMVLGHSTPAFTLATYVHPSIDDLRRSLARIF
jgi:integrase